MAFAFTAVGTFVDDTPAGGSQATGNFARAASRLYLVTVTTMRQSSLPPDTVGLTGWGYTWALVANDLWTPSGTTRRRTQVFAAYVTDANAGAPLTVTYTNPPANVLVAVDYATGADPTTPIVTANTQLSGGGSFGTSASNLVTLSSLAHVDNRTFAVATINSDVGLSWEANYTALSSVSTSTAPLNHTITGWRNSATPDLTPAAATASGTFTAGEIALEIAAFVSGPQTMTADTAVLTFTGVTPLLHRTIPVDVAALTFEGVTPLLLVASPQTITVDPAVLAYAGLTPVLTGAFPAAQTLTPDRAAVTYTGRTPALWTGLIGGTVESDLCAEAIALTDGVPLGFENWRIAVQLAITTAGTPLGSFILGTSLLGGVRWVDVTEDVNGMTFSRGGTPGSRPIAGELGLQLRNPAGKWSPTKSSYFGPGTLMRIVVGNGVRTIPVYTGITQSWNESTAALGRVGWVDVRAWEPSYLFGAVNDLALDGVVGGGESLSERIERIIDAADWQFGYRLLAHTPASTFTLQSTNLAQDLLTELLLVVDSFDFTTVPGKNGAIDITQRATTWLDETFRTIGTDVPIVADSLMTENDELRLLSGVGLSRVGGTAVAYTNVGISGRYQKRSTQRTDLVTQDPGSDADLDHVADGYLGRGTETYRPLSVALDCEHGDTVWQFLIGADIGHLANLVDGDTTFTGYSVAQMDHAIGPLNRGRIRWTATVQFDIEATSSWSAP